MVALRICSTCKEGSSPQIVLVIVTDVGFDITTASAFISHCSCVDICDSQGRGAPLREGVNFFSSGKHSDEIIRAPCAHLFPFTSCLTHSPTPSFLIFLPCPLQKNPTTLFQQVISDLYLETGFPLQWTRM